MSDRRLNGIVEKAIEDAEDEISFREANGYPEIEQQVLQMALAIASDLPGKERGVWELMSKEVAEMNVRLKRDGYPTVHKVPFDVFCKLLSGPVGDASVH
jgi:hypothetical protein